MTNRSVQCQDRVTIVRVTDGALAAEASATHRSFPAKKYTWGHCSGLATRPVYNRKGAMIDSTGCRRVQLLGTCRTDSSIGFEIMPLTRAEVEYVAALARLGLNDAEITRLQSQLSSILEHIEAIDRLDTNAIPPTAQVIDMTNVMRTDVVIGSLSREAVLENAPRQADGFFEVHAVLGPALEDA